MTDAKDGARPNQSGAHCDASPSSDPQVICTGVRYPILEYHIPDERAVAGDGKPSAIVADEARSPKSRASPFVRHKLAWREAHLASGSNCSARREEGHAAKLESVRHRPARSAPPRPLPCHAARPPPQSKAPRWPWMRRATSSSSHCADGGGALLHRAAGSRGKQRGR